MPSDCISFKETGYFSSLICDYLEEKETLNSFYHRFPKLDNFEAQLLEKQSFFSGESRSILTESLQNQYKDLATSESTLSNIELLKKDTTFTITTGHQLNIFTGPLYFLYKIISTINLTEELKERYSQYDFVPIYWMATEDHDFLEINNFSLHGKKIVWNKQEGLENANGYVGEYDTEGLDKVFAILESELGGGENAGYLKDLFKKGYLGHTNLTDATRYIVNELFSTYGLVIVDGNDTKLKSLFIPVIEQELKNGTSFKAVSATTASLLEKDYNAQVTPREINLFYAQKGFRERITPSEDGSYVVLNTNFSWANFEELQKELNQYPERFSPNVILRPVYQEVILPNLCYIGGGGELAYWFQLKQAFKDFNIPFPILLLRNSALLISKKEFHKAEKLGVTIPELFMKQPELINYKVRQISDIVIDFSVQRKLLIEQFIAMKELAVQTDKSFLNAVNAQEVKQIKGLNNLEHRLLKAQRKKLSDHVSRLTALQNKLFPQKSLQERNMNFSEFYLEYGEELIPQLKKELKPLEGDFKIIKV